MSDSGRGGQPGHEDVDRHDLIHALHDGVVVEHAAAARARAHRDHPLGLGHLVVDAAQHRRHLPRQPAGDDHQVGLARRSAEHLGAEARDVVAAAAHRHHLDGAARQAERHRPDRRSARPLHHLLDGVVRMGISSSAIDAHRARSGAARRSSRTRPCATRRCSRSTSSAKNVTICQNPTTPSSRNAIAHGIEERDLDVEEQEDHRDEVELDRLALARVADGAACRTRTARLLGRRLARAEELRQQRRCRRQSRRRGRS